MGRDATDTTGLGLAQELVTSDVSMLGDDDVLIRQTGETLTAYRVSCVEGCSASTTGAMHVDVLWQLTVDEVRDRRDADPPSAVGQFVG